MTKDEIREFVLNATLDTTMHFDEVGERDLFVERIVERWEENIQENREAAVDQYQMNSSSYHNLS